MHRASRSIDGGKAQGLWRAALLTSLALLAGFGAHHDLSRAGASVRYTTRTSKIATGLELIRITDSRGPNEIRVLDVDPSTALTLDVALATDKLSGHERPSSMAARHGAIAATNGDFTIPPLWVGAGRPTGTFAEDGRIKASPLRWDEYFGKFAISRDEQTTIVGHRPLSIWMTQQDGDGMFRIRGWNPLRRPARYAVSSPAGGRAFRPPQDACSARLVRGGRLAWSTAFLGVDRIYLVDRVRCSHRRLRRRGGIVISARLGTERAARLRGTLVRGEEVLIGWSVQESGILDTIGGHPALLQEGVITPAACSGGGYFCDRHPRTGVGVTPEGHLLLVTVDGRQPGRSVGMTPLQFARLFLYLGATNALNLDGGGSTAMVVKDRLVNRPSDGAERPVGSALLVLPGPDPGEAEPGGAGSGPGSARNSGLSPVEEPVRSPAGPGPVEQLPAAGCLALHDPASTGGMLDALARSPLTKGSHEVPPVVRRSVAVFRGREPCPEA